MGDTESALPTLWGLAGSATWRDAVEFLLLGCGTVQVCTAVMHYGYRIVEDMVEGLDNWMREKGFKTIEDFRGIVSLPKVTEWKHLNLNYKIVARDRRAEVHRVRPVPHCVLGWRAPVHSSGSRDGAGGWACRTASDSGGGGRTRAGRRCAETPVTRKERAAMTATGPYATPLERIPRVDETECVGCNLCSCVCPVEDASRWCRWIRDWRRRRGRSGRGARRA